MQDLGKMLFLLGLVIALVGGWLWSGRDFKYLDWLGRLPGDISFQNGDSRFYFPLTTCIVISLILTGIAWFMRR